MQSQGTAKDPLDLSDKYNTPVPPERQAEYKQWAGKIGQDPVKGKYDYDLQGAFLGGVKADGRGHLTDQWKKPNHPTFSNESQYNGRDGYSGGQWGRQGNKDTYKPSKTNLNFRPAPELQRYFKETEPDAMLLSGDQPPAMGGLPHPDLVDQQTTVHAQTLAELVRRDYSAISRGMEGIPAMPKPGLPASTSIADDPNMGSPEMAIPQQNFVTEGLDSITAGGRQMMEPGIAPKFGGASKIIRGGMQIGSPLIAGEIGAPVKLAATLAGGMGAQAGVEAGLKKLGVPEEYASFAGDLAGIIGAVGVHKMSTKAITAIKARVEPVLQERAAKAAAPKPTANIATDSVKEKPNVQTHTAAEAEPAAVAQPGGGQPEASAAESEAKPVEAAAQVWTDPRDGKRYRVNQAPVPDGHVRLYRGDPMGEAHPAPTDESETGRWFTPYRDLAERYGGRNIKFVDLTESEYHAIAGTARNAKGFTVPAKIAGSAKSELVPAEASAQAEPVESGGVAAITPGPALEDLTSGPHGPIAHHLSGKPAEAVGWLKEHETGEVPAALHNPATGPIDLIWGSPGKESNKFKGGYGLSHILAKHEEMRGQIGDLGDIVAKLPVAAVERGGQEVRLEDDRYRAVVSNVWQPKGEAGTPKTWLLTAFEPKEGKGKTPSAADSLDASSALPKQMPEATTPGEGVSNSSVPPIEPSDSVPAPDPPKAAAQTSLGSGFGALQPYYEKLVASLKESAAEVRAMTSKRDLALEALKRSEITPKDKAHGKNIRQYMTGERDFWSARVNQTIAKLKNLLPDHVDQEALSLMRDFKSRPGELDQFALGTHSAFSGLDPDEYALAMQNLEKIRPAIERAQNPTPKMLVADGVLTQIADMTLKEGQKLGFLESSISPKDYVTHFLHPKGEGETPVPFPEHGRAMGGKIGRNLTFAKKRKIPTLLHAIAYGLRPRTLNAFDAFTIHGDKFATARATHLLVGELKGQGVGKWGYEAGKGNIPENWVEIAPHAHPFQNQLKFIDSKGNPQVARQTLYVPKFIEEGLRPITDPNYMNRVAGFRKSRAWQAAAKASELALSLFHLKAENLMALANMGPKGWAKAQLIDRLSPDFLAAERDMVLHGGTSPIQGKTFEAYKALQPGSIPTRMDIVRKYPGVKQFDQMAGHLTDLIFDNQMRKFKVTNYMTRKAGWLAEHPNATPAEQTAAMQSIAQEINAVYGGLHWENLGVNKATQNAMRFFLLAPDWTFSNFYNVKTLGEGGWKGTEGSHMARAFWLRAIVGGLVANQGYSLLMSGKFSKNPTMAYLGDDAQGREIYQNIFFAGGPGDVTGLVNNIAHYGAFEGPIKSIVGKSAPGFRTLFEQAFNEDYLHHKITSPDLSFAANTLRGGAHLAKGILPIPFSLANLYDMLKGSDEEKATAKEIIGTILFGQAARHVAPEGTHWSLLHGLKPNRVKPEGTLWEDYSQTIR